MHFVGATHLFDGNEVRQSIVQSTHCHILVADKQEIQISLDHGNMRAASMHRFSAWKARQCVTQQECIPRNLRTLFYI
jgi:hypothetical protein